MKHLIPKIHLKNAEILKNCFSLSFESFPLSFFSMTKNQACLTRITKTLPRKTASLEPNQNSEKQCKTWVKVCKKYKTVFVTTPESTRGPRERWLIWDTTHPHTCPSAVAHFEGQQTWSQKPKMPWCQRPWYDHVPFPRASRKPLVFALQKKDNKVISQNKNRWHGYGVDRSNSFWR